MSKNTSRSSHTLTSFAELAAFREAQQAEQEEQEKQQKIAEQLALRERIAQAPNGSFNTQGIHFMIEKMTFSGSDGNALSLHITFGPLKTPPHTILSPRFTEVIPISADTGAFQFDRAHDRKRARLGITEEDIRRVLTELLDQMNIGFWHADETLVAFTDKDPGQARPSTNGTAEPSEGPVIDPRRLEVLQEYEYRGQKAVMGIPLNGGFAHSTGYIAMVVPAPKGYVVAIENSIGDNRAFFAEVADDNPIGRGRTHLTEREKEEVTQQILVALPVRSNPLLQGMHVTKQQFFTALRNQLGNEAVSTLYHIGDWERRGNEALTRHMERLS